MMERKQYKTFADSLSEAISEDLIVASRSVIENREKWVRCAEGISEIASALYPDDQEGRRGFLNSVLGIDVEYFDT